MQTYIVLLRGINVSGHRKIKMDTLCKMCTDMKFNNVRTYIQSGNIIFQYEQSKHDYIKDVICKGILDRFGFDVPVIVLDIDTLLNVVQNNSFLSDSKVNTSFLYVTFLSDEPKQDDIKKINPKQHIPDSFIVCGKTIYLSCPNGSARTKLTNNFFEKKLYVSATSRNWKTVNQLLFLAQKLNNE